MKKNILIRAVFSFLAPLSVALLAFDMAIGPIGPN